MRSLPNASSSTLKKSISNLKSTYYIPRAKTPTLVMHLPPGSCDGNILHPMVIQQQTQSNVAQGEIRSSKVTPLLPAISR